MKKIIGSLLLLLCGMAKAQSYYVNAYMIPPAGSTDETAFIADVLPHITGITVPLPWAQIDACSSTLPCNSGSYHWGTFDMSLANYIASTGYNCAAGLACKINFEVNAASGSSPNLATPIYAFSSSWASHCCFTTTPGDVCFCGSYPGSGGSTYGCQATGADTTGVPASWEQQFYKAYYTFIAEVINHYGSAVAWKSQVGYIRFGLTTGGGGVIPCPSQEINLPAVPLTLTVWQGYAGTIFSYSATQSPPMIIEGSGYGGGSPISSAWADAVATATISNGAGYGAESLALHDLTEYASALPCSNDWCNIFNGQFAQSPRMLGLQTISKSDPSCTSDPGPGSTCSLVFVLPFATERHANVFELAYEDLLCAYDTALPPNEYITSTCPSGYAPWTPYQTAIANALSGQPAGTSTIKGPAKVTGSAAVN